jgi:hypothetical protein
MKALALKLLAITVLSACGGTSIEEVVPVAYQELQLYEPAAFAAGFYTVRSQSEWNSVWSNSPQSFLGDPMPNSPKAPPQVDFQSKSVVGVSLGLGILCYMPQIADISSDRGDVTVKYRSAEPNGPTTLSCLRTWPLATFAIVPKLQGGVNFIRIE